MSVIAFDGKTMAADRQATFGDSALSASKVFAHEGVMYGCCGNYEDTLLFRQWVEGGQREKDMPELESCGFLVHDPEQGLFLMSERLVPIPVEAEKWAIGSGADFARGAMAAGKSAEQAVEITCDLCLSCGEGIEVLRRSTKRRKG